MLLQFPPFDNVGDTDGCGCTVDMPEIDGYGPAIGDGDACTESIPESPP